MLTRLAALTAVALMGWSPPGGPPVRSEADDPGFLAVKSYCAPTFWIDKSPRPEGTGFLLERLGRSRKVYLFTAQHLFPMPSQTLPAHVSAARCDASSTGRVYLAGAAIAIPGAHPLGDLATLRDLAVFPVVDRSPGLSLATQDVRAGDPVWLLAKVRAGREMGSLVHRATVVRTSSFLGYRFDDQRIGLDQTSGGAVLNRNGEVVGLNVGYGRATDGSLIGVADNLSTLQIVAAGLP